MAERERRAARYLGPLVRAALAGSACGSGLSRQELLEASQEAVRVLTPVALYVVDPLPALKSHHPRGHQHRARTPRGLRNPVDDVVVELLANEGDFASS